MNTTTKWRLGFSNQCLLALILGLAFGRFLPHYIVVDYIYFFGEVFLKLLNMVIVPLTFSTIVASFAKLEDINLLKNLGLSTLLWFIVTAIIASSIGVMVGSWLHVGLNNNIGAILATSNYVPRDIPHISSVLLDMVPSNIIAQISQGKIIPIILFAILFGVATTYGGKEVSRVRGFFHEFSLIMFKVTRFVIRLSPIGIFALIAKVGNEYGIDTLLPIIKFIAAIYVACALQLLVYAVLLMVVAHKNPLTFVRGFASAMITAFVTSSSLGTLGVSLDCLINKMRINARIAGFVLPLAATMKMDGCGAIYPAIVAIFTANLLHIDLSMYQYLLIILCATIATIGTAGVPGTASIMATIVLSSVGLPLQGLALVIGVDKIVDMMRTLTNVTGGGVVTVIVDRQKKQLLSKFETEIL